MLNKQVKVVCGDERAYRQIKGQSEAEGQRQHTALCQKNDDRVTVQNATKTSDLSQFSCFVVS